MAGTKLATPQNVSIDGTVLSWDEVENATSYDIYADGTLIGNTDGGAVVVDTFYYQDVAYEFASGMTWEEYVNSSYNSAGFIISGNHIAETFLYTGLVHLDYRSVLKTETIVSNARYYNTNSQ